MDGGGLLTSASTIWLLTFCPRIILKGTSNVPRQLKTYIWNIYKIYKTYIKQSDKYLPPCPLLYWAEVKRTENPWFKSRHNPCIWPPRTAFKLHQKQVTAAQCMLLAPELRQKQHTGMSEWLYSYEAWWSSGCSLLFHCRPKWCQIQQLIAAGRFFFPSTTGAGLQRATCFHQLLKTEEESGDQRRSSTALM